MQKFPAGKFHFAPPSRFTLFDHLIGTGEQVSRLMTGSTFAQSLPERLKVSSDAKAITSLSAMSYCHMSFDWCSQAIANTVGGKCISYLSGNLSLCPLIQASNCCCNRCC